MTRRAHPAPSLAVSPRHSVALTLRGTVEVRTITPTILALKAGDDAEVFVLLTDEIRDQIRDLVEEWDREPWDEPMPEAPTVPMPSGNYTVDHSHAWCDHHQDNHGELWIQHDGEKYVYCPVDQQVVAYWRKPAESPWGDWIVIP